MEYIAISKNVKISPRKVRVVVDSVKKKNLAGALLALSLIDKRSANPIKKTINSAVSNAVNNFNAKKEELTVKDITVGEGLAIKRFHFAGRGRTRPYKRRASHIRVILADNKIKNQTPPQLSSGKANVKEKKVKSLESEEKEAKS